MNHTCLTDSVILDLIEMEPASISTLPAALRAIEALLSCEDCWQPFEAVGKVLEGQAYATANPFAGLFRTLATRRVGRVSHKKALDDVRKPLGLYRLLLEEVSDLLPFLGDRDGQQLFLLFEIVIGEITSPAEAIHDLRARQFSYASVYDARLNHHATADEKHRQAGYRLSRGSGDPDLCATFLACRGEVLHARGQHGEGVAHVLRALDLVDGDPARRAELLVFLAGMRLEIQALEDHGYRQMQQAWEHLLEAEHLAEVHAPYFLEPIVRQLLVVEPPLAELVHGPLALLLRCLTHHHMRRHGLSAWKLEPELLSDREEEAGFAALCLAWSEEQTVDGRLQEEAAGQLISTSESRTFADAFQAQLTGLLGRYPGGHLAEDFLSPLMQMLETLRPAA